MCETQLPKKRFTDALKALRIFTDNYFILEFGSSSANFWALFFLLIVFYAGPVLFLLVVKLHVRTYLMHVLFLQAITKESILSVMFSFTFS